MRRRALLTAIAGAATLSAGCLGSNSSQQPDSGSTPTATPTSADVSVDQFALQRGVVVTTAPDAIGVSGDDSRYAWVRVSVDGGTVPRSSFAVDTGDDRFSPTTNVSASRTAWNRNQRYEGGGGWLLFELPLQADASELALTWSGGEHAAGDGLRRRLSRSPPDLSVATSKQYDDSPDRPIAIEVTNESDRPGSFVAAVNRTGPRIAYTPVKAVRAVIEGGATRTFEIEDPMDHRTASPDDAGPPSMTYRLEWVGGEDDVEFG